MNEYHSIRFCFLDAPSDDSETDPLVGQYFQCHEALANNCQEYLGNKVKVEIISDGYDELEFRIAKNNKGKQKNINNLLGHLMSILEGFHLNVSVYIGTMKLQTKK